MDFWRRAKGGGAVIFNPKIYIADFGNIKQGFLSMKSKHLKGPWFPWFFKVVFQGGFMVFGWFPWFFKVVSWFFMVFGWFPWFFKVVS